MLKTNKKPGLKDSGVCIAPLIVGITLLLAQSTQALNSALPLYENKLTASLTAHGITSSFPKNYEASKKRFLSYHKLFEENNITSLPLSESLPGVKNESLTIDGLYIKGENPKKLLILSSGIHGAEAFTGSALQDFFAQYLLTKTPPKVSVLLLHALNPTGFKYFRRANTNNVDLNRNHADATEFNSTNDAFEQMVSLYSSETSASTGILPQVGFYISVLLKYITAGKKIILNSLSGQYKYPTSVFYGGSTPEPETLIVQKWMTQLRKEKTHLLHIDIHTGFGEKAKLHLYGSDEYTGRDQIKSMRTLFPKAKIDTGKETDFYPTKGDFVDWTWKSQPDQWVVPMVFEFGTLDSQTVAGGLKSLWTTLLENQAHQNHFATSTDAKTIRKRYEELFNPQSKSWQKSIYDQGSTELISAYERLILL